MGKSRPARIPEEAFIEIDDIRREKRINTMTDAFRIMAENSKAARIANKQNIFDLDDFIIDPFNYVMKKRKR